MQQRNKLMSLTLTCRQWMVIHNLLLSFLMSTKREVEALRKRTGPDNVGRIREACEIIKAHCDEIPELEHLTIADTSWVMTRIPWVLNEAAGLRVVGLTSDLVGKINTQLQRNS